jgi:hypothetical protein
MTETGCKILFNIYSAVITLQYTPRAWRHTDITFLPKPGKDDDADKRAFCPISLMLAVLL